MADQTDIDAGTVLTKTVKGNSEAVDYGYATVTPASDADVTLSAAEISCKTLKLAAGAWASGHNVIYPTRAGAEFNFHNTSGFSAVVKTSGGAGITIANNRVRRLYCDGTRICSLGADQDPTA